jgi:predicted nucleic acid-binding protein
MIIVDSSVWIDYFNGRDVPEVATLDRFSDKDFIPFVEHLGLISVKSE